MEPGGPRAGLPRSLGCWLAPGDGPACAGCSCDSWGGCFRGAKGARPCGVCLFGGLLRSLHGAVSSADAPEPRSGLRCGRPTALLLDQL